MLSVSEYAKKFDMAVLAQDTTESVIRTGCERARDYRVAAYYTTPTWTPLVAEVLRGSDVHVGVALAFPYGTQTTRVKEAEIHEALEVGGTALDMVINIGALKSGDLAFDQRVVAALERPDVDDHVQRGAAHLEGLVDLGLLDTGGQGAVGERQRDTDVDVGSAQHLGHERGPGRGGVVRGHPVVTGLLAPRADRVLGGVLGQDRHVELLGVPALVERVPFHNQLRSARRREVESNLTNQP